MSGQPTWVLCLRYIVIEYIHVGGVASDPGVCLRTDPWFLDHLFVAVVAGALYELDEIKLSGHHDGRNAEGVESRRRASNTTRLPCLQGLFECRNSAPE